MSYMIVNERGEMAHGQPKNSEIPVLRIEKGERISYRDYLTNIPNKYLSPETKKVYQKGSLNGCLVNIEVESFLCEKGYFSHTISIIGDNPDRVNKTIDSVVSTILKGKEPILKPIYPKPIFLSESLKSFRQRLSYFFKWLFLGKIDSEN